MGTTMIWLVIAVSTLSLMYFALPRLSDTLVRFRAWLLIPGPDADRMCEEWIAALWEYRLPHQQLYFALTLFVHFQQLQTEIEHRFNEARDIENLVEQRVHDELDVLRARLAEEIRRENISDLRSEIEAEYRKEWLERNRNLTGEIELERERRRTAEARERAQSFVAWEGWRHSPEDQDQANHWGE